MKRLPNPKTLAVLTVALIALASPALAQEPLIDLELTSVEMLTADKAGSFQLRPQITSYNYGHLANHALDVVMHYGSLAPVLLHDWIEYFEQENNCWQQSILNCGNGTCADIYTGLGWIDRFCTSDGTWVARCACANIWNKEFDWVEIEPGWTTVTVIVDPFNLVEEIDETNNEITIDLMPIPNEQRSWSAIKSIYR